MTVSANGSRRPLAAVTLLAAAWLLAGPPPALGQNGPAPTEQADRAARPGLVDRRPPDPERVRGFIEGRLERIERERMALLVAADRLERGDDPAEVRVDLAEALAAEVPGPLAELLLERRREADPARDGRRRGGAGEGRGSGGSGGSGGKGEPPAWLDGDGPIEPDELVAMLDEHRPALAEKIRGLRERAPERVRGWLDERGPRLRQMLRQEFEAPDLAELRRAVREAEAEALEAARDVLRAGENEAAAAHARLAAAAGTIVDLRVRGSEIRVEVLERQVEELRTVIAEHAGARESHVERVAAQLLRRAGRDSLVGSDPPPPPAR